MILRLVTFPFRYLFSRLKKSIGKMGLIRIEPLYAFGNEKKLLVKGRVVESYRQSKPSPRKNYFQNILAAIRRYAGSSVPAARVEVSFREQVKILESDSEGIIDGIFESNSFDSSNEETITFKLLPEEGIKPEREKISIHTLRFDSNHDKGVISDIDDTILITHATRVGKKLWLSISKNAYTRRPFPGVSQFYHGLSGNGKNPFFYVSSSDWNLFDLIRDFLNYRKIPAGPLLLKDLHVNLRNIWKSGGGTHQHKLEKIRMLMELYPGMKFVLVGDSGQHDPELYAEVIRDYPGRVISVYIREIRRMTQKRKKLMEAVAQDPAAPEVVFVKDTQEAMAHARKHNLIKE